MISDDQLQKAICILSDPSLSESELDKFFLELFPDRILANRVRTWIPEAFGIVLASHMEGIILPTTFSAKSTQGNWVTYEFKVEPIFQKAIMSGMHIYHSGPRNVFERIANRSSTVDVINKALNAGSSINGATLSGPALIGIPAEVYVNNKVTPWIKLLRKLGIG